MIRWLKRKGQAPLLGAKCRIVTAELPGFFFASSSVLRGMICRLETSKNIFKNMVCITENSAQVPVYSSANKYAEPERRP